MQSALKVNTSENGNAAALVRVRFVWERQTRTHTAGALSGCTYLLGSYLNVQAKLTTGNRHITF